MKKILVSMLMASIFSSSVVFAEEGIKVFSDVSDDHPNYTAIFYLYGENIIDGYDDGTFKPDGKTNRAELLKMLVNTKGPYLGDQSTNCFTDVKDEWFAPYVCYAKDRGWVSGYGDGSFGPGSIATREESIKIILNAFFDGDVPVVPEEDLQIALMPADVSKEDWVYVFMKYAMMSEILDMQHIQKSETGFLYLPKDSMSRKEVAQMLYGLNLQKFSNVFEWISSHAPLTIRRHMWFEVQESGDYLAQNGCIDDMVIYRKADVEYAGPNSDLIIPKILIRTCQKETSVGLEQWAENIYNGISEVSEVDSYPFGGTTGIKYGLNFKGGSGVGYVINADRFEKNQSGAYDKLEGGYAIEVSSNFEEVPYIKEELDFVLQFLELVYG